MKRHHMISTRRLLDFTIPLTTNGHVQELPRSRIEGGVRESLTGGYVGGGLVLLAILLLNLLSSFRFQYSIIKSAGKPSSMSVACVFIVSGTDGWVGMFTRASESRKRGGGG